MVKKREITVSKISSGDGGVMVLDKEDKVGDGESEENLNCSTMTSNHHCMEAVCYGLDDSIRCLASWDVLRYQ